ncbi:MAG: response regulator [Desulfobacterales bacterium]|nr:response regulator [Desulfobacterales bacterium]
MKRSLSILTKIWLSLSILILGYLISMVFGFFLGRETEQRLYQVSESLVPASHQSQLALNAFKEQIKYYKDAVVSGEYILFETAFAKANLCDEAISKLVTIEGISSYRQKEITQILYSHKDFTEVAQSTYKLMAEYLIDEASSIDTNNKEHIILKEKASFLNNQTQDILEVLTNLSKKFNDELKKELSYISTIHHHQRYLNLIVFIAVVITALSLISILIVRSISKPLKKTFMLESAVEQSVDGISVTDLNGYLIFGNQGWASMHGYEIDDLIGMHIFDFHTDEQLNKVSFPSLDTIKEKGAIKCEIGRKRKDDSVFPSLMTMHLLKDADENMSLVTITRDITEQKQNEEELKAAKEQAEVANNIKSEFLANMSHEIRTPMNSIIGMCSLLLDTKLDREQREYIETTQISADSLLSIINDILDFSKIEAGKLELEYIKFNLRKAIEDIMELLAMNAHEKGLEFVYIIGHDIPCFIKGDLARLRQILINLTGNAIKFTEKGEVVVKVSVYSEDETNISLKFEVYDSGIGIPQNSITNLFKSFSQVDSSATRKFGGTGLGLAISKKLARMMGGEINVESKEGKGSKFWFTAVFKKTKELSQEQDLIIPDDIKQKRVLVVDDNLLTLESISLYLKLWGIRFEVSSSGEYALILLKKAYKDNDPFELVLIDHIMPNMDGETLCTKIKSDISLKNTDLVIITPSGLKRDLPRMKKIGFLSYLTKPIKRMHLYDCIMKTFREEGDAPKVDNIAKSLLARLNNINKKFLKRKKPRILLAEDNLVNQKLTLRLLEKIGYYAEGVFTGVEVVQKLEKIDYDVVLMDVQMPDMDGIEATKVIRNPESKCLRHDIPIIAMTAHAMKGDREKCISAGMDDYVSKPIKLDKLSETIEKYLSKI